MKQYALCVAVVFGTGCGGAAPQTMTDSPLSALTRADAMVAEARAKDAQAAATLNEAERVKREAEASKAAARGSVLGALGTKLAVADAAMRQLAQEKAAAQAELEAESAPRNVRGVDDESRVEQGAESTPPRNVRGGNEPNSGHDQRRDEGEGSRGEGHHDGTPPVRRPAPPPPEPDTTADERFQPPGCERTAEGCPILEDAPTPAVYFKVISWQARGLRRTSRYPSADWSLRVNLETRTVRLLVGQTAVWQSSDLEVGKCYRGQATGTPRISEVVCSDAASAPPPPKEQPAPIPPPPPPKGKVR